jgi:photosystem II stability/assembly factor-like uncharacterized protein
MSGKYSAFLLRAAVILSLLIVPLSAQQRGRETDDPDLPATMQGKIDKRLYLRRRSEHIAKLRGIFDKNNRRGLARGRAIRRMEQQERNARQTGSNPLKIGSSGVQEAEATATLATATIRESNVSATVLNTTSWTPIGPAPIPNGQTQTVTTAVSGRVAAVAVDPSNANVVYVGTAQGGLYRTLDGGQTWTAMTDSAQSLAVGAVTIDPHNPSTVWVGTGESAIGGWTFFGVGVYKITNANTPAWTLSGPYNLNAAGEDVFSGRSISKIIVHPSNPDVMYVGTTNGFGGISNEYMDGIQGGGFDADGSGTPARGLYRTTSATSVPVFSKVPLGSNDSDVTDFAFDPSDPTHETLVLVVRNYNGDSTKPNDGGVWRTTGISASSPAFTRTLVLGTATERYRGELAVYNNVGGSSTVLLASADKTNATAGYGSLRKSTDGGQTWGTPLSAASGFCHSQCNYDIAVAFDPTNANVIYLGGSNNASASSTILKKSINGGSTFTKIDKGLHADTHAVAPAPNNSSIIYTGNDGGVWRSTDGGANWTSRNTAGFSATQFMSLALHSTDRYFTLGGTQDNGTNWLKPDNIWTRADSGDGGVALIDQNATSTTMLTMYHTKHNFAGTGPMGYGRVTKTSSANDGGWVFLGCGGVSNGISCSDSAVLFYAPMALGPGNPNTLYFGSDRLYRSSDSGRKMVVVSQVFQTGIAVSAIGISPGSDAVRLVGLENGKIFVTNNGSAMLRDADASNQVPDRYLARAVIDKNDTTNNTAYVTLSGFGLGVGEHVWKTTNLGAQTPTWAKAGGSGENIIPDVPVNAFVIDSATGNLYAGTDIGVYKSTDAGANWFPFNVGLPRVAVFDMAVQNNHRILRIATHGRGLWEIAL